MSVIDVFYAAADTAVHIAGVIPDPTPYSLPAPKA